MSAWLRRNSSGVDDLHVYFPGDFLLFQDDNFPLDLPFQQLAQLQRMRLAGCNLPVAARAANGTAATATATVTAPSAVDECTAPNSLAALTSLTQLEVNECEVDIAALAACSNLRHLHLEHVLRVNVRALLSDELAAALPQLTKLTHITLSRLAHYKLETYGRNVFDTSALTAAICCLPQLLELQIQSCPMTAETLAHLPPGLTKLQLTADGVSTGEGVFLSPADTPRLQQLTQLQDLSINGAWSLGMSLSLEVLAGVTKLTCLKLSQVVLHSKADSTITGVARLLNMLQRMQQLQHLELSGTMQLATGPECYAALTMSSQLTYLDLWGCNIPHGANQHIFRAATCSRLVSLAAPGELFSQPGDFDRLASSCPGLQQLSVYNFFDDYNDDEEQQTGSDTDEDQSEAGRQIPWNERLVDLRGLTALQHLNQLTSLYLGELCLQVSTPDCYHASEAIAMLTQSRQLRLRAQMFSQANYDISDVAAVQLTAGDLMRLTSLTGLTSFQVDDIEPNCGLKLRLTSQAAEGSPPDVWKQLSFMGVKG